ncbi:2047_t:CDS:2 [Entrophospora sp. SA101]|nr:14101_t:CDS:2 [Entrophospora sp. SA101]CAJ0836280.1 2047_t:CDS:2 [Entrophospora sp. SA101]
MSKSRGNIINPDPLIEGYGADALRLAIIFLAPAEQTTNNFYQEILTKTTEYYQNLKFNLIIPQLMIFMNKCYQSETIPRQYALNFLQLLNPLAPHLTEEIWSYFQKTSLAYQP